MFQLSDPASPDLRKFCLFTFLLIFKIITVIVKRTILFSICIIKFIFLICSVSADEQETGPFDPALGEPYAQSGVLPRSNYKTIPHNNAPYHTAANGKTPVEYFVKFIRYPTTDPLLAGVVGIPLFVLVMGFAAYYVVLLRRPPNYKNDDINENSDEEVPVTVLHVQLEAELKKAPSPSEFSDEEFVPPPSPPPKYSDVVHNV